MRLRAVSARSSDLAAATAEPYPSWKMGERLLAAATYVRLTATARSSTTLTPTLAALRARCRDS